MDADYFSALCTGELLRDTNGIGTLNEKPLHAILKSYFSSENAIQEKKLGKCVVDLFTGSEVIEIQTKNFGSLQKKLPELLQNWPVTVVYPIPAVKWVEWLDLETGTLSGRRKSPKKGIPADVFYELYKIKSFLQNPNLFLCLVFIEENDIRIQTRAKRRGRHCSVLEVRQPLALLSEQIICCKTELSALLPAGLPAQFDTKELANAYHRTPAFARRAAACLVETGALSRAGRKGRNLLWQKNELQ